MIVDIDCREDGSVCVARIEGEIDTFTAPDLLAQLRNKVDRGCLNVVIDLAGVTYLDSSALGVIVWLTRALEPQGGRVVLAGPSGDVLRILEISGISSAVPGIAAAPDVGDALAGIAMDEPAGEPLWTQSTELPADPALLASARADVTAMLEPLGMPEGVLFDVRVAVGEALANAVRHGSAGGADTIEVTVTAFGDRVVIDVADSGAGFSGVAECSTDPYATSGRGVMFMRALMDRVDFVCRPEKGTSVRLVKHLGPDR